MRADEDVEFVAKAIFYATMPADGSPVVGKDHRAVAYKAARAAISAIPRPMCEWQLIETAPKDGTKLLLAQANGSQFVGLWDNLEGGWRATVRLLTKCYAVDATHWMPLPIPPVDRNGEPPQHVL